MKWGAFFAIIITSAAAHAIFMGRMMRKKSVLALILIFALALSFVAVFAACDDASKLETPTGFTFNQATVTLSWSPVEHAYSYDVVVVNEKGEQVMATSVPASEDEDGEPVTPAQSLAEIRGSGTYTVRVQALADRSELDVSGNPLYKDSDVAEYSYKRGVQFDNPQNVRAEFTQAGEGFGIRVSFDAVEGAADYTINIMRGTTVLSELSTGLLSNFFETYTEKDSAGNETTKRYDANPDVYTVRVRADAGEGSGDLNSGWSTTQVTISETLDEPYISRLVVTGATTQRIEWGKVSNAEELLVEAWKIGEGESALDVLKKVNEAGFAEEADYSYSRPATASSCSLSNLNIEEPGQYLLTVRAVGDGEVYLSSGRVNSVNAEEATAESKLVVVNMASSPVAAEGMPEGGGVNVTATASNAATAEANAIAKANGMVDRVQIRFNEEALENINLFKIILSSVNTSSSNSLSDITVEIRMEKDEEKGWIIYGSDDGDDYRGELTREGEGYVLTYDLDRIFHEEAEEGESEGAHLQSSRNVYGRYFNVKVQVGYYESHTYTISSEDTPALVAARTQSIQTALDASYLSYCMPSYDAASKTYTIREEVSEEGVGDASARAQFMYIQKLMLEGDECEGVTFVIGEDIEFSSNAWLAVENGYTFKGTIESAEVDHSAQGDGSDMRSGEYIISDLTVVNAAKLQYSRSEEHGEEVKDYRFTQNYAMFPSFAGTLSHVNFLDVTATDVQYSYTVKSESEDGGEAEEKTEYRRVYSSAAIAGEIKSGARVEYVFVSGSLTGVNMSGALAAVNSGEVIACESDVSLTSTSYDGASEVYVGGLIGKNAGKVSASAHRGSVTATDNITTDSAVGGFVGYNSGTIVNSYATGAVKGNGVASVGGFVGENATGASISSSYFGTRYVSNAPGRLNTVSGTRSGGFVGNNAGNIERAYAVASVNGNTGAGGFAAQNSGTIAASYSVGRTVAGESRPAFIEGEETPEGCYMVDTSYDHATISSLLSQLNEGLSSSFASASAAQGFETPLVAGLLYGDRFEETITANTTPTITATVGAGESADIFGYNDLPVLEGYTAKVYVTDGPGRLGRTGTALVKYEMSGNGGVVSVLTLKISM